ncbi:DUF4282 domain-containing protein [Spirillospora sp. NBC_01491]|uniref:DUF4282 domain-containing protein n=1 Tax=Spirillospora sp. NBC_01491 TaxID=2976007 RepID=UPI002E380AB7|nr:DUF4282 domain-containing protein [Spirillospora sp. NBC_01491]
MGGPYQSRSVLGGLLDLRFRRLITPRLIGWVYAAGVVLVVCWTLAGLLLIWGFAAWMGAGWWLYSPVVIAAGALGVLLLRVTCEWILMAFTRGRPVQRPALRAGRDER